MSIKVDIRTEQEVFEYITNVMLGEDIVQNLKSRFEDEMDSSVTFNGEHTIDMAVLMRGTTFEEWVVQFMVDLVSEDEMNY
jgi:recombinational DNA repair ATPase RecF